MVQGVFLVDRNGGRLLAYFDKTATMHIYHHCAKMMKRQLLHALCFLPKDSPEFEVCKRAMRRMDRYRRVARFEIGWTENDVLCSRIMLRVSERLDPLLNCAFRRLIKQGCRRRFSRYALDMPNPKRRFLVGFRRTLTSIYQWRLEGLMVEFRRAHVELAPEHAEEVSKFYENKEKTDVR